jgi:hypothetical protein
MELAMPLAGHTFSGQVEHALKERFEANKITRVLQSLHLLEADYEHVQWFPSASHSDAYYQQHAPSYVPGLPVRPFWRTVQGSTLDGDEMPSDANSKDSGSYTTLENWCNALEENYELIRSEFQQSISNPKRLQNEGNNVWAGALTEDASSYGRGWKTLVLLDRGTWDANNAALFPQTSKFLHDTLPDDFAVEIFFAQMDPKSTIQPHSDFTNFVLTSHLALDIPYSGQNKCRLSVGDVTQEWINGKVTVFDTSLFHDAVNESEKTRYILMFRLWHPDLSKEERKALQFIYDCLVVPELASAPSESERFMAEQRLQILRSFPSDAVSPPSEKKSTNSKGDKKANKQKRIATAASGFGGAVSATKKNKKSSTKGFGVIS